MILARRLLPAPDKADGRIHGQEIDPHLQMHGVIIVNSLEGEASEQNIGYIIGKTCPRKCVARFHSFPFPIPHKISQGAKQIHKFNSIIEI